MLARPLEFLSSVKWTLPRLEVRQQWWDSLSDDNHPYQYIVTTFMLVSKTKNLKSLPYLLSLLLSLTHHSTSNPLANPFGSTLKIYSVFNPSSPQFHCYHPGLSTTVSVCDYGNSQPGLCCCPCLQSSILTTAARTILGVFLGRVAQYVGS